MGKSLLVFTFGFLIGLIGLSSKLYAQDSTQHKGNSQFFYRAPGKYLVASKKPDLQPLLATMKKEEAERQKEVAKQRAEEEKYARMYGSYYNNRRGSWYANNSNYGYRYGYNNNRYNYGYNSYPYYGNNSNWGYSSNWNRFGYNYPNYNYGNYGYNNSVNFNHHHYGHHHSSFRRSW